MKFRLTIFSVLVLSLHAHILSIEETITYKEPFILCRLAGSISSEGMDGPGNWADSLSFTLIGPNNSKKRWRIEVNENGGFNKKLPMGSYRFSIEVDGWDDAEGTVIINKKAKKQSRMSITLGLS
jgi:hypothetical protein